MRPSFWNHRKLAVVIAFAVACDSSSMLNTGGDLSSESQPLTQGFAAGSLIIPMDTTYQNSTMLTAYGLVEALLTQGITVNWAIQPGKVVNGTDFTASATSLAGGATITNYNYTGGPFVIDVANATAALTIITAWNTPTVRAVVHQATSSFNAYIQEQIVAAPLVAIDADGYENLAFNYLNGAGIPDSAGNPWPTAVLTSYTAYPDVVTPTQLGTGVLLNSDGTPAFTNLTSMHYNGTPTNATVQGVRNWLAAGPLTLAVMECAAITAFENNATYGYFLTTAGLFADTLPANATIEVPDTPLNQVYVPTGTTLTTNAGAVNSFDLTTGALQPGVQYLAAGTSPATKVIWMSGHMGGNSNYGVLAYLAGHDYGGGAATPPLPITTNPLTNGVRLYLDAFLETAAIQSAFQPVVNMTLSSPAVNAGGSITWTITYSNTGVGFAGTATLSDVLPAGVTFVSATGGGTNSSGTVMWSLGNLKSGASGSVTVTGTTTTDGTYTNSATLKWLIGRTHKQATSNVTQNLFPSTAITSGPASLTDATSATFTFMSSVTGATFNCSLDSAAYAACPTPQTYTGLSGAAHTLSVVSVVAGGNTDLTPATWSWTVNITPPVTTITTKPANPTNVSIPVFAFASTKTPSTFQCELDSATTFTACPTSFPALADGSHTLTVRAVDSAGNVDPAPPSYTWVIDTQKPKTTIVSFPVNPNNQTTAAFTLASSEANSTFQCSLDSAAFATCTAAQSYTGLLAGSHTFTAKATDAAGNVDPAPPSYTWTINLTKPVTTIVTGPANPTNQTSATFTFSATESPVTYQCKLDSATTFTACPVPATFTGLAAGSHTLQVEAVDSVGNVGAPVSDTWVIDLTAPVVTITSGPATSTNSTSATFALSATETLSNYLCSLDGATFASCTAAPSYTGLASGTHTLEAGGIDAAGNTAQPPATYSWTISTTKPVTTIVTGPANPTNATSGTFVFSSSESPVTYKCKLDSATSFTACPVPPTFTGLAAGSHTLTVESIDVYGNSDATPPSYTWVIDTTPPVVTITSGPAAMTNATTAAFTMSASETVKNYLCSLDGAAFVSCSATMSYASLANGSHTFEAGAIDAAGNTAQPPASYTWTVSTTKPTATVVNGPPTTTNSTTATFVFGSSESPVTYLCKLDSATTYTPCPASFTGLANGSHTLSVEAVDQYGNTSAPVSVTWTVDTTPPVVTITSGPALHTNSTSAAFTLSASETVTTYLCSLDGAAFASCTSTPSYSGLASGSHTLQAGATDAAGNSAQPPASYSWTVDTTKPTTTIVSGPANPTNATTAAFTLSSNKSPVTFNCKLDAASGFTPCPIPVTFTGVAQGAHLLTAQAEDSYGNVDPNPPSYSWTVNTTPPVVTITSGPAALTNSTSAAFTLTATETVSRYLCSMDGASFTSCTSTPSYTGLASGAHTLLAGAIDAAGNNAQPPASYTWTINTKPPVTTFVSTPPSLTNATIGIFVFGANESPVTFACELDSATTFTPCQAETTLTGLTNGSHTLTVAATDEFGNTDPAPPSYTWTVDTVPPVVTITAMPPALTNATGATFGLTASEVVTTFLCGLDGAALTACSATPSYTSLSSGPHVLVASAVDAAGNMPTVPAEYTWTIQTAPPTTSIVASPPSITDSTTASFTFGSTEPNSTFFCELDGATTFTPCPQPAVFNNLTNGSHTLTVEAVDPYGNVDPNPVSYTWTVNTTPPMVTITSGPPALSDSTTAPFTLTSSETGTTYECSLDGAAFAPCSSTPTFTNLSNGPHTLLVTATDPAGNVALPPASYSWTVSTMPPTTTIVTMPPALTNATTAIFTFSSSESPATYQCELDAATTFTSCSNPATFSSLSSGPHTLTVASVDQFSNVDPNPPSYTWTIDTTPPVVTITSGPAHVTNATTAAFALAANEMLSTFLCGLDGAALAPCSSTPSFMGVASGTHTLLASGIDNAGNTAASPASYVWTVGTSKPTTTIVAGPPNPSTSSTAVFVFSSNESPVTYQCELDGVTPFAACPATFTDLAGGSHTLVVRAVDSFGNVDPNPPSYTWVVDTTPPTTTIVTGPPALTNQTTATFTFSSDKSPVTYQCELDGSGAFAACPTPDEIDNLADGLHVLQVRAVDASGLTDPAPAVATWTVDTVTPTTTIVTAPTAVSTSSTASFNFASDESPATYQCILDGAGQFTECANPSSFTGLTNGSHTLQVRAVDAAGNVDPNPPSYTWVVDSAPPTTNIGTEKASDGSPEPSGFSSDKTPVTYQCRLDGATEWTACPTSFAGLAVGTHTLQVRAVDQYGVPDPNPPSTSWTVHVNVQLEGASLGCSSAGMESWGLGLFLVMVLARRRTARLARASGR